jgi:hypothetical protein
MANKKWIQKANKKMERKGTVGAFTKWCGGKVTQACIQKGLNSDDDTIRRRAQFAKAMRVVGGSKKAQSGLMMEKGMEDFDPTAMPTTPSGPNHGATALQGIQHFDPEEEDFDYEQETVDQGVEDFDQAEEEDIPIEGLNKAGAAADFAQDLIGDDPTAKGAGAVSTVGGAIKGAKALSALGPLGMAAGAIGGGIKGLISHKKNKEAANLAAQEERQAQFDKARMQRQVRTVGADTGAQGGKMRKHEGGVEKPIGFGVTKLYGRKHKTGGIVLKDNPDDVIEAESGELIAPVKTKSGDTRDFIVSDHLKADGGKSDKTIAEALEGRLKHAGSPRRAQRMIAAAVRDNLKQNPDANEDNVQIAQDGLSRRKKKKENKRIEEENRLIRERNAQIEAANKAEQERVEAANKQKKEEYEAEKARRTKEYEEAKAAAEAESKRINEERLGRAEAGGQEEKDESGKRIYGGNKEENIGNWLKMMEKDQQSLPEEFRTFDFDKYKDSEGNFDVAKFNTKEGKSEFRSWYNDLPDDLVSGKLSAKNDAGDLVFGQQWDSRRLLTRADVPEPPTFEDMPEFEEAEFKPTEKEVEGETYEIPEKVPMNPTFESLGMIAPAVALSKDLNLDRVAPAYRQAGLMNRVTDRAAQEDIDADVRAMDEQAKSQIGGAAGFTAGLAARSQARRAKRQAKADARAENRRLAAQERAMDDAAKAANVASYTQAAARNQQATNFERQYNLEKDLSAIDAIAQSAKAMGEERQAQRIGHFENLANDPYGAYARGLKYHPKAGKRMFYDPSGKENQFTPEMREAKAADDAAKAKAEKDNEAKKGRYIPRYGRTRRRFRRR